MNPIRWASIRGSSNPEGHTARFGRFQSVARSGQKSIAQGLSWVNFPPEVALKGPPVTARLTQGKPWAKPSCPFGAGPSGRTNDAKQLNPGLNPGLNPSDLSG